MRPSTFGGGLVAAAVVVASMLVQGCSGEGDASSGLDWFESSCGELGGTTTARGNCFIPCESPRDCPLDGLDCPSGNTIWISGYCAPGAALQAQRGCGPGEWYSLFGTCRMACTAAGRDAECPAGFHCIEESIYAGLFFCTGYQGGGGACQVSCPSGCCSPSGASCCSPPYCAGDCIGSPCCR